jgi:superfamily II DNA or RNA helicase
MKSQHKYLTERGYIISRKMITKEEEASIKRDLIVKTESIYAPEQEGYPIFLYSEKYLYLPKYYGIEKFGAPVKIKLPHGAKINAKCLQEPLPFQLEADAKLKTVFCSDDICSGDVCDSRNAGNGGVLSLPCGYGKCHGAGTNILLYPFTSKTSRLVENIKPGDLLLGDDLTSRTVLSCTVGYGPLFKVIPEIYEEIAEYGLTPYVINADHILSLRGHRDEVININVIDYLVICRKYKNNPRYKELLGYTNITKLRFKIKIIPCGYGLWYGFSITGNRLYTLHDYQITHNTYLSLRTACRLQLKTMILVSKEFLRDQWIEAISRFTTGTYGILQQKKMDLQYDFCIAMVHTLCLRDYEKGTFDDFGFMIIDECHHLASEMFVKSLCKLRPRFILGLSATPERPDGLSHVFHKFIGPVFHKEKRIGVNNVIIKKLIISAKDATDEDIISCYTTKYNHMGLKNTIEMTTCLSECMARNLIIIKIIKELLQIDRTILVLSSRRRHLHTLSESMTAAMLRKSDGTIATCGFYYGKLDTNSREHKEMLAKTAQCDVIFGTEHVAKEGLDIPSLNTLIFATPPGIYIEQSVGRILRKYHEHHPPLVVDICDKLGNYIEHGRTRDQWYTSEGYHISRQNCIIGEDVDLGNYINDINVIPMPMSMQVQKNKEIKKTIFKDCMI